MIENNNSSKMPSSGEFLDIKKFIGVASVTVLAVNPNNAMLRKWGWDIQENAEEPKYTYMRQREDGAWEKYARIRFLLRINDFEDKPVIPYDIWIRPEFIIGKNTGKCRVIDSFGRCAWASKDEVKSRAIPQYSSGPADISNDYKGCHPGQEKVIAFLHKYLNITPLQIWNNEKKEWVASKAPGRITIDDWNALCEGNATEIAEYLSLQPDNRVKIILGIRTTEDNKTFQTILDECDGTKKSCFIGNGATPDKQTDEYALARKRIDEYFENNPNTTSSFSALPVREYKETATEVKENTDAPVISQEPEVQGQYFAQNEEDLPF